MVKKWIRTDDIRTTNILTKDIARGKVIFKKRKGATYWRFK